MLALAAKDIKIIITAFYVFEKLKREHERYLKKKLNFYK